MTTQSRRVLGKNPKRRTTKGAFGSATSEYRKEQMMERYNEAFTEKLARMRARNEAKSA